ncbi:MAG: hypothetical protein R3B74_09520 [Nitrospirales bacterium]|nr:hypothetical protein [Nitrospirales bacterium]
MKTFSLLLLYTLLFFSQFGCTSTIFKQFDVSEMESVSVDAKQRAIIVMEGEDNVRKIFCAEPEPRCLISFWSVLISGHRLKEIEGHLDQTWPSLSRLFGDRNATRFNFFEMGYIGLVKPMPIKR